MTSENFVFSEISCSEEAAEQLLAQRPGLLHAKDSAGCTVLHWCAQKGYAKIAAQLLAPRTGLPGLANVLDTNRLTPLHHAAQEGHEALVTQLAVHTSCSAMLDPDWTVLHCALKRGRDKMVGHLLDHFPELIKQVTFLGFDGLYAAASQGYHKAIAELLARRPKLDHSSSGCNPLHAAAREGHDKVITQLLDYNPSLLEHTAGATTALHEAVRGGHVKIIEQLLTLCPKLIDAVTFNGSTPLHAATSSKCEKVLELLIAYKPELIDALNQEGHTPLQSALRDTHSTLATIDCLFAAKPEQLYHVDRQGNTLLHHVVASAWKFRFDREANYTWEQFKAEADREPHIAKVWGMNPAAARIANSEGDTPFDLAVEIHMHKTIELLLCAFSLDEIATTFAKSDYPLERVRPTLHKQLVGVLGRDIPHVVFEYLDFKRNNKRKK